GHRRSDPRRGLPSRPRPGWRVRHRRGRGARGRAGVAGLPGAGVRGVPRLLPICAQGPPHLRVHDPVESGRPLRAAAHAGRGAVRAGDVRRAAQRRARGLALILAPALALVLTRVPGETVLSPPEPAAVRAAWQPSDAALLDRAGEVLHERRIDATRRRLAWTALDDVSP